MNMKDFKVVQKYFFSSTSTDQLLWNHDNDKFSLSLSLSLSHIYIYIYDDDDKQQI